MDYIFKSQVLDIDPKSKNRNVQYYHWAEKKRIEKERTEYDLFRKVWGQLDEEDEKEKERVTRGKRQSQKKVVNVRPQELYQKNVMWKQGVQEKLQKKREEMREEKEREFEIMKESKFKQPKLLKDQQHKGPVKAWKQRFNNYLRARCGQDYNQPTQNDFTPQIDRNSRRITKQMIGKVQDRLIEYGEKLKEKKIEMQTIYQEEIAAQRVFVNTNNKSIESQISDVYWRLYKDGQRLNQKRNEHKSEYSFAPQINQYSIEIASRITEKRAPLYQSKIINQKQPEKVQKKDRKSSQKGFNDFLKRNQALLSKIQKNKMKKVELIKQKQNNEIRQCTFTPVLNPKSIKMFANYNSQHTNNSQLREKIEQLSKIDSQSGRKKLNMVRSELNDLNNSQGKLINSTERLRSDGNLNLFNQSNNLFIQDHDSISNFNQSKRLKPNESSGSIKNQSEAITERIPEPTPTPTPIYNINQQLQQDSIQKQRDSDWQRQLIMMERQIEAMMDRATN